MPAPKSRRPVRPTKSAPAKEPVQDDLEVMDPEPAGDYAEQSLDAEGQPVEEAPAADEATSGSRRSRAAGRSSRRAAASSGRASGKRPAASRRVATPEERAARRAAMMTVVKILLGVVVGGAVAFGVWWLFMRVDPRVETARQILAQVEGLMSSIDNDINITKAAAEAENKRKEAIELLDKSPELGFAKATPDLHDPKLAGEQQARRAYEFKEQLDGDIKARVERLERDTRVQTNLRQVLSGFGRMPAMSDAELTNFEKDTANFMDNPVMPGAGRIEQYVTDYKPDLATVRTQLSKIEQEKARRLSAITDLPVQQARGQAAVLVQQEKFQEALSVIDEIQRKYETANLAGVRQYVTDAAKQAWETASAMAEENYKTYRAPGTTKDMAEASLAAARTRMEQVVERFGIDEYVSKAKDALGRFAP